MRSQFLAFDLGAESGRAMLGHLRSGVLELTEVHRFSNEPVPSPGALRWDVERLWREMRVALDRAAGSGLAGVGVDAWGVDYAMLDATGQLVEPPYHYRDDRTNGAMAEVFARVSPRRIYEITGIQFLPINTLYQLYAACRSTPQLVERAHTLLTIPDLFNYRLTSRLCSEYTIATTTQCVDARARTWAGDLMAAVGLPARLFAPIVEPGTVIGTIEGSVSAGAAGVPVVAPASHDTASAVAAVRLGRDIAFLSSGTWSLLGIETSAPVLSDRARDLNFTNEGGAGGTIRLLKNITGLWLLQACRRAWAAAGDELSYDQLLAAASDDRLAFRSLVDPDDELFHNPDDMPSAIQAFCRRSGQEAPSTPAAFTRTILESLACKYRVVLDSLEEVTGRSFTELRIIGGGSRNRLLNQFTADATGRSVVAGPVEATALGNIAVQLVGTGCVGSLDAAREIIERSFPIERFEPRATTNWERAHLRFKDYLEAARA